MYLTIVLSSLNKNCFDTLILWQSTILDPHNSICALACLTSQNDLCCISQCKEFEWAGGLCKEGQTITLHASVFCSLLQDTTVDSEGSGEDDSESASQDERKVKKRRGAEEKKVPFMTHVVSVDIVKELMYEFKSKWAIFGTAEAGVAARGALALKHPVVMFANNQKHEELLREGLEAGIVESCLVGGDFSSKALAEQWAAANKTSDSDSSSESDSGDHTSEQSADKAKGSKKEKKSSKKEKGKKEKKDKNKKTKKEKNDKKAKKVKKDKKEDKKEDKKDKKDNKKEDKKEDKKGNKAEDVLAGLIAKGSGTQG